MHEAVRKLYGKGKPKARAILRARGFFSRAELILQYKAHVLGGPTFRSLREDSLNTLRGQALIGNDE